MASLPPGSQRLVDRAQQRRYSLTLVHPARWRKRARWPPFPDGFALGWCSKGDQGHERRFGCPRPEAFQPLQFGEADEGFDPQLPVLLPARPGDESILTKRG